jgi:hypothetical protein
LSSAETQNARAITQTVSYLPVGIPTCRHKTTLDVVMLPADATPTARDGKKSCATVKPMHRFIEFKILALVKFKIVRIDESRAFVMLKLSF